VISAWLEGYGIFAYCVFQEVNYMSNNELMITTITHSLVVMWISHELQQLTALGEPTDARVTRY